jgi:ketosteroid isomerase-like protein
MRSGRSRKDKVMRKSLLATVLCVLVVSGIPAAAFAGAETAAAAEQDAQKALDAFNRQFIEACRTMDHKASKALWAEDGTDLIQGIAPMVGKAKIAEWLDSLAPQLAGAKMLSCTVDWQDIRIHGDLAYEWGINRQTIQFPPPKDPSPTKARSC